MKGSFVPEAGLEPAQPLWPKDFKSFVSTISPFGQHGAKNGTRTRDPDLGKVVLYQLSYFRNMSLVQNENAISLNLAKVFKRLHERGQGRALPAELFSQYVFGAKRDRYLIFYSLSGRKDNYFSEK